MMSPQVRKRKKEIGMSLFLLIVLYSASSAEGGIVRSSANVIEVTGVQETEVHIPCKAYSTSGGQKGHLILWYKDDSARPIYSFDARTKNGHHWVDEVALGDRAQFIWDVEEPYLILTRIQPQDEGIYTCRVDYRRQPTQRGKTLLTVIIPPGVPSILDENGVLVLDDVIGPYNEGTSVKVTCQVVGGKPSPQVIWWRREDLLDNDIENKNVSVYRNTLTVGPLTRQHLDAFYVCQAFNNDMVLPLSKGVTLDVNFKPLSVEIMGDRIPLTSGEEQEVSCHSIGAKPPALITWWLDGIDLTDQSIMETSGQNNISKSTLSITPKEEDAGKLLTCKAQSPVISHQPLEDSLKLEIYYSPKVDLELGQGLDPLDIREGDNVTFDCNVNSNPTVDTVTWYHKGMILQPNVSSGILVKEHTLMLEQVERKQKGVYSCGATNIVGDGQSDTLFLDIKHVPVCSSSEIQVMGAAKADDVDMKCIVDASPDNVVFKWYRRGPQERIDITEDLFTVQDRTSRLVYHIRTEFDYGEFECYAANELGEQSDPCVFSVVPAGKPDSLENCTLTNQTTDTLFINCLPGFNGGLDQQFVVVVQAYDDEVRGDILRNATETEEPVFVIEGLQPGASYLLAIYAENVKGRSEDSVLHGFTLPTPPGERITLPSTHIFPITPILGVLIGVVGALVIVAVVVVVVMKLRSDARSAKGSPIVRSDVNRKRPRAPLQPAKDGDDGPDVILCRTDPPYEDVDGIPSKLKHVNIYETVQCDSKENSKHSENADKDDVEYAELTFTNGKNKNKNNKKSGGANGAIRTSDDNTIYASIDHTRTAQNNALLKQQPKQAQLAKQDQKPLKGKQAADHLEPTAQGETDDIPLMDSALESSV